MTVVFFSEGIPKHAQVSCTEWTRVDLLQNKIGLVRIEGFVTQQICTQKNVFRKAGLMGTCSLQANLTTGAKLLSKRVRKCSLSEFFAIILQPAPTKQGN